MRSRRLAVVGGGTVSEAEVRKAIRDRERAVDRAAFEAELARDMAEFRAILDEISTKVRVANIAEACMPVMSAYLAGELSVADAAEVAEALRTEPLMRQAFASLVAAWQAPSVERQVTDAEVDSAWERFKALRAKQERRSTKP